MAEDEIMIEDDAIALEDTDDSVMEDSDVAGMIPFIMDRYSRSEDYRYQDEERWLRAYRNYRGLYGPDVQFTEAEKSRVFIKVTKTKIDLMLDGGSIVISGNKKGLKYLESFLSNSP